MGDTATGGYCTTETMDSISAVCIVSNDLPILRLTVLLYKLLFLRIIRNYIFSSSSHRHVQMGYELGWLKSVSAEARTRMKKAAVHVSDR